jgi:hypothetical protein
MLNYGAKQIIIDQDVMISECNINLGEIDLLHDTADTHVPVKITDSQELPHAYRIGAVLPHHIEEFRQISDERNNSLVKDQVDKSCIIGGRVNMSCDANDQKVFKGPKEKTAEAFVINNVPTEIDGAKTRETWPDIHAEMGECDEIVYQVEIPEEEETTEIITEDPDSPWQKLLETLPGETKLFSEFSTLMGDSEARENDVYERTSTCQY